MRNFGLTEWYFRMEPCHDYGITEGVQARIADPLAMMGRQWSVGEFLASSGGRPVRIETSYHLSPIDEAAMGTGDAAVFEPIVNSGKPLEALIEREDEQGEAAAWNPQNLEYAFAIKSGDFKLEGKEYDGSHLDWYSVDLTHEGDFNGDGEKISIRPATVRYNGQTDPAWFAIENGKVNLGDLTRPHLNLLTMLLVEFALVYSEDWFMVPIPMPVGTIRRVDSVLVVDTFGVVSQAKPIGGMTEGEVDLFTLARCDGNPTDGRLFVLLNSLWNELESEPLEHVSFVRDEMANVAWAIEHRWRDDGGRVVDRHDDQVAHAEESGGVPLSEHFYDRDERKLVERPDQFDEGEPGGRYRGPIAAFIEQTMPPEYWVPYLQRFLPQGAVLRRGRTVEDENIRQYKGKILSESRIVSEHEVGRHGVSVARMFQLARDTDGNPVLWLGRVKKPAKPTRTSGLLFDALVEHHSRG